VVVRSEVWVGRVGRKGMLLSVINHRSHRSHMRPDRSTKDVAYASGLLPDWNARPANNGPKKSSRQVDISCGGLEDDDADAINPYSAEKDNHSKALKKVVEVGKRDLSRQNEVRLCR